MCNKLLIYFYFQIFFRPLGIHLDISKSKFHTTLDIAHCVYKQDGFKGFYRGYVASVCTYAPNSAFWWSFYTIFQGAYIK